MQWRCVLVCLFVCLFDFVLNSGPKFREEKKPQDQSSLTSHFFVCEIFWDRWGGHSQPMALLGILKETRGHGEMNRHLEPSCEARVTAETAGMVVALLVHKRTHLF